MFFDSSDLRDLFNNFLDSRYGNLFLGYVDDVCMDDLYLYERYIDIDVLDERDGFLSALPRRFGSLDFGICNAIRGMLCDSLLLNKVSDMLLSDFAVDRKFMVYNACFCNKYDEFSGKHSIGIKMWYVYC